ncbi:MAG TPA: hypothetical protein VFG50_05395 [Rhodothermales bacterium]|nr:hypothetical protein [Rhodothermales bacterium]
MAEKPAKGVRDNLSAHYAEIIGAYQQDHHALMEALRDDTVSMERFEQLSEQMHKDVNALKELKMGLKQQRDKLREENGST